MVVISLPYFFRSPPYFNKPLLYSLPKERARFDTCTTADFNSGSLAIKKILDHQQFSALICMSIAVFLLIRRIYEQRKGRFFNRKISIALNERKAEAHDDFGVVSEVNRTAITMQSCILKKGRNFIPLRRKDFILSL